MPLRRATRRSHGDRVRPLAHRRRRPITLPRSLAAPGRGDRPAPGSERRLVLLVGANTVDALVIYLAALAAGHPVLLVPGDKPEAVDQLIAAYRPDVVARADGRGRWVLDERRAGSAHSLHPDLALLLSTSGSTGSPKLVRLSHENLQANAAAIAEYLESATRDRAATTLPMHYCYGLSVINSHLLRGAGLILTDLSVADSCFWELFRQAARHDASPACRTPSTCSTGSASPRWAAPPALRHPGRRAARPGAGGAATRPWAGATAGTCS